MYTINFTLVRNKNSHQDARIKDVSAIVDNQKMGLTQLKEQLKKEINDLRIELNTQNDMQIDERVSVYFNKLGKRN